MVPRPGIVTHGYRQGMRIFNVLKSLMWLVIQGLIRQLTLFYMV